MTSIAMGPGTLDLGKPVLSMTAARELQEVLGTAETLPAPAALRACMAALGACCAQIPYGDLLRICRYDVLATGEAVCDLLLTRGASLDDLRAACAHVAAHLAALARPAVVEPSGPPDPYPGLRLWGMSYPEWGAQARRVTEPAERATWAAAEQAIETGTIGAWVEGARAAGLEVSYQPGA